MSKLTDAHYRLLEQAAAGRPVMGQPGDSPAAKSSLTRMRITLAMHHCVAG